MKRGISVIVLAGLLLSSGCASIISGTTQQVTFDSNPNGADVVVDGNKVGMTPCIAILQRSKMTPRVELKKEGYRSVQIPIMSRVNYWIVANVLWGWCSTTAFAVDFTSHDATVEYDPNRYFTTLEPVKEHVAEAPKPSPAPEAGKDKATSKAMRYLVVNYDAVAADIARGQGEYLTALFELLGVPDADRPEALAKLKKLYVDHAEPVPFARAVDAEFMTATPAATSP